jgi:hypothetical protein
MSQFDNTFVIEVCYGCKGHCWNNRHDEDKYNSYRDGMAAAIQEMVPGATVLKN